MAEKIIRDPVHDVIAFRLERPIDALLFRLLNAAEFQRLRRIVQLGMASLAYPGADHSRYSHSLGVMETARKMLAQLQLSHPIDESSETICLVAALLHDLGHGPLSHVFEYVSGIEHEKLTQRLIADPASDVHRILVDHDRQLPALLLAFYRCESGRTFLHDILSSQLDADRFDYLLRDNLMTGSRYGDFDLRWLLHSLTIDPATRRLAVTWKGISAAESYLQSRYHMYRNVYFHKVVRSAEGMVKLALQRAKRLAVQDRLGWPPRDHTVYKALLGQRLTIEEFTELDDISVMHCFKLWTHAEDPVLAGLCRGLLYRKVFKTIDITHLDNAAAEACTAKVRKAIESAGGDGHYDVFIDEPSDTPFETYEPQTCDGAPGIAVLSPAGKLVDLSTLSPLPDALSRRLNFRRIHLLATYKSMVEPIANP
jgi:HD superfamily phosphohydrolase